MKIRSVFVCLLVLSYATAKKSAVALISNNEENVNLITTDIENFWNAYNHCKGKTITIQEKIFDSIYIKNASVCLKEILTERQLTARNFINQINSEADYFSKCKSTSEKIKKYEIEIREYLKKFKAICPAATYADIYFMFTGFYTGGQSKKSGIGIGMDFWSLPDSVPVNFNNPLFKELVRKIDVMPVTIIHELVHKNQPVKNSGTLLEKCLIEGSADFIAYLVTQKLNNPKMYSFADKNENDLWLRFKKDMAINNTNYWLYNNYDSNRPRDLGYWMGFKICEKYYNISTDKSTAVYNIMNIKDSEEFLTMSKYNSKFN